MRKRMRQRLLTAIEKVWRVRGDKDWGGGGDKEFSH